MYVALKKKILTIYWKIAAKNTEVAKDNII